MASRDFLLPAEEYTSNTSACLYMCMYKGKVHDLKEIIDCFKFSLLALGCPQQAHGNTVQMPFSPVPLFLGRQPMPTTAACGPALLGT